MSQVLFIFFLAQVVFVSGKLADHFGFMEMLFNKCSSPSRVIDTKSPILARAIFPTAIQSKALKLYYFYYLIASFSLFSSFQCNRQ